MTKKDLNFITAVLRGKTSKVRPDWFSLLGFLQCHKIAGLFYNRAKLACITLPYKAEKILGETFNRQKRKVEFMRLQIAEISDKLMRGKIEHAFLKGSVLSNAPVCGEYLYADGERVSNDIDLLVRPDGIGIVSDALKEMGFIQGKYDAQSGAVIPFSRAEVLMRRMNRGEVAPFVKKTNNSEFPFAEVDINFSLGNTPGEGKALLEYMLNSARVYSGKVTVTSISPEALFLHLIMHQYKESVLFFDVARGKDSDLYKLADIFYVLNSPCFDISRIKTLAKEFGIEQKLGWVLRQTGEVFGDEQILELSRSFGSEMPEITDYAKGKTYVWSVSPRERILRFDGEKLLMEI